MEDLNDYINEAPIVVKYWETELDRDEGLSEIYKYYTEAQKQEAINDAKKLMHRMDYACVEVDNENTEETYYWTDGVTEDYFDTDVKNESKSVLNEDETYILDDINRDLAEFIFEELFDKGYIDRNGKFKIANAEDVSLDFVREVYDDDITEQEYNEVFSLIKNALNNPNLTFYDGEIGLGIELNDNHTLWDINLPEGTTDFDFDDYNNRVQMAIDNFAYDVGTQVYQDGRSGRHICVPVNLSNVLYYDKLAEKQREAEKQFIADIEDLYNGDLQENKLLENKQDDIIAEKYGLTPYLDKLTQDLMNLEYVTKVDYDLMGYIDKIEGPITLVSYNIDTSDVNTYIKEKSKLKNQVLDVMKNNGVNVELEEFEDNDTYFYIVSYSTNWDKVVKKEALNDKTKLTYAYKDNGQYYYKDRYGKVYVDMSPLKDKIDLNICVGDYDEPAYSVNAEDYELINNPKDDIDYDRNQEYENDYMLLGRLVQDCKYYLGNGNRFEGDLWAGSVDKQIAKMKELWDKFPEDMKPEWLSMEDIENYEKEMKTENKTERRVLGEYKEIKTEDEDNDAKIQLYNKLIDEMADDLGISKYEFKIEGDNIKFRYNDKLYFAEPRSTNQVNIYDDNHNQIGWGVNVNKIKEEVFTEYGNDDFLYELVGGEYAGTYTGDEARKLPILEPELSPDDSDIRANGGFTHRKELDKQLQFKGYLGPMWNGTKDGKAIIRYETQEVYDMMSENKLIEEDKTELYKRIEEEPRTEKYEQGLKLKDEIISAWENKDLEVAYNKWEELFNLFSTGYDDEGNQTSEWNEEQSIRDMIELHLITDSIEDNCVYDVTDYGKAKAYKEMGY